MSSVVVGELYDPTRTSWPHTDQLRLGPRLTELVRFVPGVSAEEVHQHRYGPLAMAAVDLRPFQLVVAFKFGEEPWCDTPFEAHRLNADLRGRVRLDDEGCLVLRTVLVDASTGIVQVVRVDRLSRDLSGVLADNVAAQLAAPYDDARAGRLLERVYQRCATSELMVREMADVVMSGSEPFAPEAVHDVFSLVEEDRAVAILDPDGSVTWLPHVPSPSWLERRLGCEELVLHRPDDASEVVLALGDDLQPPGAAPENDLAGFFVYALTDGEARLRLRGAVAVMGLADGRPAPLEAWVSAGLDGVLDAVAEG
ncbi:hypothetical protein [Nocardioides sp. GY 10127]|uniref:hypothetical protein n=1 Tax=Nocardioides sp. GY 10127 TaxID=2569762 RepID=UPI0010A86762|nr:hypothetical protein [Nocardioides sp. GY 10127]TIC84437.1 hypothetical protein E8D37_06645 [Nocardioides sp. GY 10127]